MTFNEGMQIDTSTASSSGGGGRMIALGGGLGGLLIVVVALLLGVDPGRVVNQQQMNTSEYSAPGFDLSQCKTGADANKYVQCRVVATGNSVDAVWHQLMQGYTRPHVQLFSGQVETGCGVATSAVGPFYCPVDQDGVLRHRLLPGAGRPNSVPAVDPSHRSTWWLTNTAITCRTAGHPRSRTAGCAGRRG